MDLFWKQKLTVFKFLIGVYDDFKNSGGKSSSETELQYSTKDRFLSTVIAVSTEFTETRALLAVDTLVLSVNRFCSPSLSTDYKSVQLHTYVITVVTVNKFTLFKQ